VFKVPALRLDDLLEKEREGKGKGKEKEKDKTEMEMVDMSDE